MNPEGNGISNCQCKGKYSVAQGNVRFYLISKFFSKSVHDGNPELCCVMNNMIGMSFEKYGAHRNESATKYKPFIQVERQ